MAVESGISSLKKLRQLLLGAPIPTSKAHHERLSVFTGLPVYASDNLSSSAYANEAILAVLLLYGLAVIHLQIWVVVAITILIAIVVGSYRQTIYAYPNGGGSYIVASENLGEKPGLLAGAALMIDYILTVAVSVAAGVAALVSAFPAWHDFLVPMSVAFIAFLSLANLRGVRESGIAFALPTYSFLLAMAVMLVAGISKAMGTQVGVPEVVAEPGAIGSEAHVPLFLVLLRAFAAGCTALTGIEAVSNGTPVFKPPEARNAARTLVIMATIVATLFLGIGYIALHMPHMEFFNTKNPQYTTLVSQIAAWSLGGPNSVGFYFVQFSTAAILILAANTAFADFPRLSSLLARDGYLPRALTRQGDRLVFQNGIVLLAIASAVLVWAYHGELDQLLPLYAVGVFLAFTLSQAGMVAHWRKLGLRGHRFSIFMNGLGMTVTGIVTIILFITKFTEGAWLIAVLAMIFFALFTSIKRRYQAITKQLTADLRPAKPIGRHTVLLLVPRVHNGIIKALDYALGLHGDCRALHIAINEKSVPDIKRDWEIYGSDVPLVVLHSPYRSLLDPVLEYVDQIRRERPDETVTVIVPEAIPSKWYHKFLQENLAFQLKYALGGRRNVVVTNVRYFLD